MIKKVDDKTIMVSEQGTGVLCGHQRWFLRRRHSISGCGPTTAALVMMYMAVVFPEKCRALYPYKLPAQKDEFIIHMNAVRKYVKPGVKGLTDDRIFASSTVAFAKSMGVKLIASRVSSKLSVGVAYGFIKKAIDQGYLPALLILKNPSKALSELTWHWMAVTGYDDEKRTVFVSTNGEQFEHVFDEIWIQQKPYKACCVYFYPE